MFYERIEPVAESFGDLDPEIDGRIDDASAPPTSPVSTASWNRRCVGHRQPDRHGTHRDETPRGRQKAQRPSSRAETYQPPASANGAAELLDEISASKITGEEERYSHLDLLDFQANLDGSKSAFELLEPALQRSRRRSRRVDHHGLCHSSDHLDPYRSGDRFVPYTSLSQAQTKALAQAVDALAEPMSLVAAKLVAP